MKCHRGTYGVSEPVISPGYYLRVGLLLGFLGGMVAGLAVTGLIALFVIR